MPWTPRAAPKALLSDGQSAYVQFHDDSVVDLATGEVVFRIPVDTGFSNSRELCAGSAGRFACLVLAEHSVEGQPPEQRVILGDSAGRREVLGGGARKGYSIRPLGIHFGERGDITCAWREEFRETIPFGSKTWVSDAAGKREVSWDVGAFKADLAALGPKGARFAEVQFVELHGDVLGVFRSGDDIVIQSSLPDSQPLVVARAPAYEFRAIVGPDGWLYVFYHDASDEGAHVAVSRDGEQFRDLTLDHAESGWQLDATRFDGRVYVAYYYFRNAYNKGIRMAALSHGDVVQRGFTLVRQKDYNTGWYPQLVSSNRGMLWLSYWEKVEQRTVAWQAYESGSALQGAAIPDSGGWEDEKRHWYLQLGAGAWLTWWLGYSGVPGEDVAGTKLDAPSYQVAPMLMNHATMEARYRSIDIALLYGQALVDRAARDPDVSQFFTSVQLRELFPGHDFKLEGSYGHLRGRATHDGSMQGGQQLELDTTYRNIQVLGVNKWRVKYGFAYTDFDVPVAVSVFTAASGSTRYAYESTHFRTASLQQYSAMLGYEQLDYSSKYETYYNDLILDFKLAAGLTFADFEPVPSAYGDVTEDTEMHFGTDLRLGWLWFQRWQDLSGMALYARPAYAGSLSFVGGYRAPGEREGDEVNSDSARATLQLISYNHGPWLDVGVVW